MVAHAERPIDERQILDRALGILIAALAAEEARRCGASKAELAELRACWVPDADKLIDQAEELGLLDGGEGGDHE